MKFKIFPKGYDPMVAAGPRDKEFIGTELEWTPKDTAKMRELEKQFIISERKPTNQVYQVHENQSHL